MHRKKVVKVDIRVSPVSTRHCNAVVCRGRARWVPRFRERERERGRAGLFVLLPARVRPVTAGHFSFQSVSQSVIPPPGVSSEPSHLSCRPDLGHCVTLWCSFTPSHSSLSSWPQLTPISWRKYSGVKHGTVSRTSPLLGLLLISEPHSTLVHTAYWEHKSIYIFHRER